ncbi:TetR/AcrR family transcriptional regulator [Pseudonocardia sp. NPDC049635]|uniref:TetR/AcrR family transcriptional regulator n=1 Tax=Pseudonocardia sp. NPDC049635 TaxID=3155506 RepID=UPI0033BFE190
MPRKNRWTDLVAAAGEEFREHGYDHATLDGIGARIGILKGSVYNYVSSKEELLLAVVEAPARSLLGELEQLGRDHTSSVAVRLRELVRIQVRVFADHYPAAFVYLQHVGRSRTPAFAFFDDMDRRYTAAVETLLAEGARTGELSLPASPRVATRAVVGMLDWMQHWFTPRGPDADQDLADQLFAMMLGGLLSGGGVRGLSGALPPTSAGPAVAPPPARRPRGG